MHTPGAQEGPLAHNHPHGHDTHIPVSIIGFFVGHDRMTNPFPNGIPVPTLSPAHNVRPAALSNRTSPTQMRKLRRWTCSAAPQRTSISSEPSWRSGNSRCASSDGLEKEGQ
ncbi:hypothetical protein BV25DRAFT_350504 [Artomyces pyxidatus]|uniref:Uncharacterized protein n=1 Tax=Artomyces pyxidatus TaxID=48021 RepID=A0ACB8T8D1_9AGAM|nr:hypothetical protein BV25DRAFT_350504 [Artomyces pyxidatus]